MNHLHPFKNNLLEINYDKRLVFITQPRIRKDLKEEMLN
jgi:hypothetical protein